MKKRINISIGLFLFTLLGCASDQQVDINDSIEGRFLKSSNGQSILVNDHDVVIMGNDTEEGEVCEDINIGDKIVVIADAIDASYPSSANVIRCKLIEEGSVNDLPNETIDYLQDMGWVFDLSD
ncbi:hypothetical protein MKY91_04145 [Alkalicoccobacillus gibsonii]|uniref:Lipoprotein n=1 Tax=Alkalicoccobacillus gibsonii TaxID=79881 RepID=A0ABU9VEN0_9BACI